MYSHGPYSTSSSAFTLPGAQPTCNVKGGYVCPYGTKSDGTCSDKAVQCGDGYCLQNDNTCCPRGTKSFGGVVSRPCPVSSLTRAQPCSPLFDLHLSVLRSYLLRCLQRKVLRFRHLLWWKGSEQRNVLHQRLDRLPDRLLPQWPKGGRCQPRKVHLLRLYPKHQLRWRVRRSMLGR